MSQYIHFTDEQKQRATCVDLEVFLRSQSEKLLDSGREKRLPEITVLQSVATNGTTTLKNAVVMQLASCSGFIISTIRLPSCSCWAIRQECYTQA